MNGTVREESFESAVTALYSLMHQSKSPQAWAAATARREQTISDMRTYLDRMEYPTDRLATKTLVHITGTKGKGSTACLCESMLRHAYQQRTLMFTSPHLVDIRERIRVNGKPISKTVFAQTYWTLRRKFEETASTGIGQQQRKHELDSSSLPELPVLPGYFRMLTLMTFHIAAHYQPEVDVVILEVGLGGRYDATNVFDCNTWKRVVCGITVLDYDHVRELGNTLEQIAWEKGGIFLETKLPRKQSRIATTKGVAQDIHDSNAYSAKRQKCGDGGESQDTANGELACLIPETRFFALDPLKDSVRNVLTDCAKPNVLKFIDLQNCRVPVHIPIGLAGRHQRDNAELAFHLCESAMAGNVTPKSSIPVPSEVIYQALTLASWPARCQTIHLNEWTTIRLDGAHTVESIAAGVEWYKIVRESDADGILIFNCSHERNPVPLLQLLTQLQFHSVFFCRPHAERPSAVTPKSAYNCLLDAGRKNVRYIDARTGLSWQDTLLDLWNYLEDESGLPKAIAEAHLDLPAAIARLVNDTLTHSPQGWRKKREILVTGSLYLAGTVLESIHWKEDEDDGELANVEKKEDQPERVSE